MKKKISVIVLFLLTVVFTVFGLSACKSKPTLTFENWQERTEETVVLGTSYKVEDVSVKGSDGKTYYYKISVFDSKNVPVMLVGGEFDVEDADGYTVVLTVETENGATYTRTVVLKVVNDGAPIVSFTPSHTGVVGKEYVLPVASAKNAVGGKLTYEAKLYYVNGETREEIPTESGKFTPQKTGKYEYEAVSTDSTNGKTAKKSVVFAVRTEIAENCLENFNDELSVLNCKNKTGVEYLPEYQGATGVLHVRFSGNEKPGLFLKFFDEAAGYKHTPFVSVKIKMCASRGVSGYQTTTSFSETDSMYNYFAISTSWTEYEITLFDNWNMFFDSATGDKGAQLFWMWLSPNNTEVDIYVDEITYVASPEIVVETDKQSIGMGDEVALTAYVKGEDDVNIRLSVLSPSGREVVLNNGKFTADEVGEYKISATIDDFRKPYYVGTETIGLLCKGRYIKYGNLITAQNIGKDVVVEIDEATEEIKIPTIVLYDEATDESLESTPTVTVTYENEVVPVVGGKFATDKLGKYLVNCTFSYGGEIYTLNVWYVSLVGFKDGNGITFDKNGVTYGIVLENAPLTYEATIRVSPELTKGAGVIFGNYTGYSAPYTRIYLLSGGRPCVLFNGAGATFETVDVRSEEFVHLAITLDKSKNEVNCYLNGVLKETQELVVGDYKMKNECLVGGDLCSGNHNVFLGEIKSLVLFDDVRTNKEIKKDIDYVPAGDKNIVAMYDFNLNAENGKVKDIGAKGNDLTVKKVWLEQEDLSEPSDYAFSFAVVGDTQSVVNSGVAGNPEHLKDIYRWLVDNRDTEKIKFVMGLGDICETLYAEDEGKLAEGWNKAREWALAKDSISILDGEIPYSLCRGNHDDSGFFNSSFGKSQYSGLLDGTFDNKIENSYQVVNVNGCLYLIMTLDYNPSDEVLAWADGVISAHSNCKVIITTHSYLHYDKNLTKDGGTSIWEKLGRKHENIVMILSGHVQWDFIEVREDLGDNGNKVVQILVNPQDVDLNGATGLVAMFYFFQDGKSVDVRYYSTVKGKFFKAANQLSFTLDDRISGAFGEDTKGPTISVAVPKTGVKGVEYVLPEYTVRDLSNGRIDTEVKVYLTSDQNKTAIAIGNGKFVPTSSGSYTFEVTATDIFGNVSTATCEIAIRENALAQNVLEDFSNEAVTDSAFVSGAEYEYLESFMGKTGVLHLKPNQTDKSYYYFRLFGDKEQYPYAFNGVSMLVWVDARNENGEPVSTSFYDTTRGSWKGFANSTDKGESGWYKVTFTDYYSWEYFIGTGASGAGTQLFWTWTKNTHIYIDEITFEASSTPTAVYPKGELFVGNEIEISATVDGREGLVTYLTVKDPDGVEVPVVNGKITLNKKGVWTVITRVDSLSVYAGTNEEHFTVLADYLEYTPYADVVAKGTVVSIPQAKYYNVRTGEEITNATITYGVTLNGVPVAVSDGKFTATDGIYHVDYTVVVSGVEVAKEHIKVYATGNAVDFAASQTSVAQNGEIFDGYEGAEGIVRFTASESVWTGYVFDLGDTADDLETENWNYIAVRLLVSGAKGELKVVYQYNDGTWDQLPTIAFLTAGEWAEVKFYKGDIQKYGGLQDFYDRLHGKGKLFNLSGATGELYVDYVSVVGYHTSTDGSVHTVGFDSDEDFSVRVGGNTVKEWLATYEGGKGVAKLGYGGDRWNGFKFNVTDDKTDLKSLVFRVYIEGTGTREGDNANKAELYLAGGGYLGNYEMGEWVTLTIDCEKYASNITLAKLNGSEYLFTFINANVENLYVDCIDVVR